jgi:hypothetical protein
VSDDGTFFVHLASDEAIIRKHAEMAGLKHAEKAGLPDTRIMRAGRIIDPAT